MEKSYDLNMMFKLIDGELKNPFNILGAHKIPGTKSAYSIRVYLPIAAEIQIVIPNSRTKYPMPKVHPVGFFETVIDNFDMKRGYKLDIVNFKGEHERIYDAYNFLPTLDEKIMTAFRNGIAFDIYKQLGAKEKEINGVKGVQYTVWAPNAKRVSVVGLFNDWDGRLNQMLFFPEYGVWSLFIPGISKNSKYKFEIKGADSSVDHKSDPVATFSALRPSTSSLVHDISSYNWKDSEWMKKRKGYSAKESPISIYQVHAGSWKRKDSDTFMTFKELANSLIPYVVEMRYTHINLLPIMEHRFDSSLGYETSGYFSVTSRYGTPEDFKFFVDKCHENNVGVILDWTAAYMPKDTLGDFDGTNLYEIKTDEDMYLTVVPFDYSKPEVSSFILSNAYFWLEEYHIDALMFDNTLTMIYKDLYTYYDYSSFVYEDAALNKYGISLLKKLNTMIQENFPGVMTICDDFFDDSTLTESIDKSGYGFTLKTNPVWKNLFLQFLGTSSKYKKFLLEELRGESEHTAHDTAIIPLSYKDVTDGRLSMVSKVPSTDSWHKFATIRCAYGLMYASPDKKMLFMGDEIGQLTEWDFTKTVDWKLLKYSSHKRLKKYMSNLNKLYRMEKAFLSPKFKRLTTNDSSVFSFTRKGPDNSVLVFAYNFTSSFKSDLKIDVIEKGKYIELINSDALLYGGENNVNRGILETKENSLNINLAPYTFIIFKLREED